MYDKEKVYDEKIFPLMSQIIEICKENDMQFLASCYLKNDKENGNLLCSTYLESKEENSDELSDAVKVVRGGYIVQKPFFSAMTIYGKGDSDGETS